MKSIVYFVQLVLIILVISCQSTQNKSNEMAKFDEAPGWASSAIWYQIFVERFRNGNPANDPTLETMKGALMDSLPPSWTVTPWNHNWYEQEAWDGMAATWKVYSKKYLICKNWVSMQFILIHSMIHPACISMMPEITTTLMLILEMTEMAIWH